MADHPTRKTLLIPEKDINTTLVTLDRIAAVLEGEGLDQLRDLFVTSASALRQIQEMYRIGKSPGSLDSSGKSG